MKTSLIILFAIFTLSSCEKPKTNYEQAETIATPVDTSSWEDDYVDGGVLTTNTVGSADTTMLGTKWVITKVNTGFTNSYPNDTIWFDTNTTYRVALGIGGGFGSARSYTYATLPLTNNVQLLMKYWVSLGGSHYSGEFGGKAVDDGIINGSEFVDDQNLSLKYLIWMKKL